MNRRIYLLLRTIRRSLRQGIIETFRWCGRKTVRLGGPLGFFSILEKPEDLNIILPAQVIQPAPPDALRLKCGLNQQGYRPWPIFWKKIPQARLVSKILAVLNDKKELMAEDVYGVQNGWDDPGYKYLYLPPATLLPGAWTSIFSRWCHHHNNNYYHWLLDGLPRLALLDRFPPETGILMVEPLASFQKESLEILNLLDRCRPTLERHLLVEDYYFSSPPAMSGCDNPYAIQFLRDRFLQAGSTMPLAFEKIYITRRGTTRRADNEQEMIDFLQGEGWTIIQAENYSFKEQIALFANARAVCSIHGAGLANLVWCQKGCKVLELCAENFLNGVYEGLAAYRELDYRYMIFAADRRSRIKVDLQRLRTAVQAMNL